MAFYGIDLGTTFSAAACVDDGIVRVVPLEALGPTLPSLVLLYERGGRPCAVVGARAKRKYRELVGEAPEPPPGVILVRGAKNYMGVGAVGRSGTGGPPWTLCGHELSATDVSAILLRTMAELVRQRPGLPRMDGVVVTHPQRFRSREKLATAQAARLAGLELKGLITEPDAAAWAYGVRETGAHLKTFMVFDFGGGTLDVTIMRKEPADNGRVRIAAIASYGIQLGGLVLDRRIRDELLERYVKSAGETFAGLTLADVNEATRERLLEMAEQLKIELNREALRDPAPMERLAYKWFTPVFDAEGEGDAVQLRVQLKELSQWIAGELDRAMACADEALARAELKWEQLDRVLLTGGSSQLYPLYQRMRDRVGDRVMLQYDNSDDVLNPSTIVAAGAAQYGAALAGAREVASVEMRGVLPDAFSVRAMEPDPGHPGLMRRVLKTLIAAGTPTPFVGSAEFRKRGDGSALPVEIFEGRSEAEATCVGTYQLQFEQPLADGARVQVQLAVQPNGVLTLRVREHATGLVREARIDDAPGLYSEQELEKRKQWLAELPVEFDA